MLTASYGNIFKTKPLKIIEGIPVFSNIRTKYVTNYQRIAHDHVASIKPGMDNPFIEDDLWRQLEQSTRALIKCYVTPGSLVLDAGVGMGRVLESFKTFNLYGIDISLDYLHRARDAGFEVAFSLIEDMPYNDAIFDAVVACDVLEHVIDLNQCCEQLLRVLRPGGIIIIRVPNEDNLDVYLEPSLKYEFIHLRNFSLSGVRLLFEKIFGCKYVDHSYVAPYLKGAPSMKLRQLKPESPIYKLLSYLPDEGHPLSLLKQAVKVNEQEYINWIYDLRDHHPELFASVVEELVYPLEVNVVFKKP